MGTIDGMESIQDRLFLLSEASQLCIDFWQPSWTLHTQNKQRHGGRYANVMLMRMIEQWSKQG